MGFKLSDNALRRIAQSLRVASDDEEFEDKIPGGKADEKEPKDFDDEQISKGIKVEMEHTDDPELALEIAMDHLEEIPDYYDRLSDMEEEADILSEED